MPVPPTKTYSKLSNVDADILCETFWLSIQALKLTHHEYITMAQVLEPQDLSQNLNFMLVLLNNLKSFPGKVQLAIF